MRAAERPSLAGAFFAWREAGVGRRWVPCPRCARDVAARLLDNLLELLCPGCGRNVSLERARQLADAEGAPALLERLQALGVLSGEEAAALGEGAPSTAPTTAPTAARPSATTSPIGTALTGS